MGYVSTWMGDRVGTVLMCLMALRLALVDQNPFWPCLNSFYLAISRTIASSLKLCGCFVKKKLKVDIRAVGMELMK